MYYRNPEVKEKRIIIGVLTALAWLTLFFALLVSACSTRPLVVKEDKPIVPFPVCVDANGGCHNAVNGQWATPKACVKGETQRCPAAMTMPDAPARFGGE